MAFMKLQSEFGVWYLVDGSEGTDIIPADVCGSLPIEIGSALRPDDCDSERWAEIVSALKDYVENRPAKIWEVEAVEKWGARYSAPGYMDATDWVLGETQEDAESECKALYGDEEEEDEEEEEEEEDDPTDPVEFYREPNGDYCCVDRSAFNGSVWDGRGAAIPGLVSSVQSTGISNEFLSHCVFVSKSDVPAEWLKALVGK